MTPRSRFTAAWWRSGAMQAMGILVASGVLAIIIAAVALALHHGLSAGVLTLIIGIMGVVVGLCAAEIIERWGI